MPDYLESDHRPVSFFGGRTILVAFALLFVLFLGTHTLVSNWVDLLWFRSLGFGQVFIRTLGFEVVDFLFFTLLTFVLLYSAFAVIRRSHAADFPAAHDLVIGGRPIRLSVSPVLRIISSLVAAAVSLVAGLTMLAEWPTLALCWYAPRTAAGAAGDPIFGHSVSFFLFTLPALQIIENWLLVLSFTTVGVAILFLVLTSGARAFNKEDLHYGPSPWRGLSLTMAFLLAVLALNVFVSRYATLLNHHTIFDGATYTDAHITIPGRLLIVIALLLGAAIAATNSFGKSTGRRIAFAVAPAAICYIALGLVSSYVANFVVKPNELVREQPFITHNIQLTRQAYGLDHFSQQEFPAETTVTSADPVANQPTLQNIRLWDWRALQDTLRQVQEIRTYYDFPDIDIDRYPVNGTMREVMLAVRELNVDKLPVSSRNWINERLIYTHGYGITMNPVNGFTPEGLPNLLLSNMPVQSTVPGLNVTRPEIYFGELTDTDIYVKTRQQEFDYPQGQSNNLTSYQGTGGILLGSLPRRIASCLRTQ